MRASYIGARLGRLTITVAVLGVMLLLSLQGTHVATSDQGQGRGHFSTLTTSSPWNFGSQPKAQAGTAVVNESVWMYTPDDTRGIAGVAFNVTLTAWAWDVHTGVPLADMQVGTGFTVDSSNGLIHPVWKVGSSEVINTTYSLNRGTWYNFSISIFTLGVTTLIISGIDTVPGTGGVWSHFYDDSHALVRVQYLANGGASYGGYGLYCPSTCNWWAEEVQSTNTQNQPNYILKAAHFGIYSIGTGYVLGNSNWKAYSTGTPPASLKSENFLSSSGYYTFQIDNAPWDIHFNAQTATYSHLVVYFTLPAVLTPVNVTHSWFNVTASGPSWSICANGCYGPGTHKVPINETYGPYSVGTYKFYIGAIDAASTWYVEAVCYVTFT